MQNIYQSLQNAGIAGIQVSITPHSMDRLLAPPGFPRSSAEFNPEFTKILRQILQFLSQQNMVFRINVYPFFSYRGSSSEISLVYALLDPNAAPADDSGLQHGNLFIAMVDTVISAMGNVGFGDVGVLVTESGWASGPDGELAASVQKAQSYNGNLVKHVLGGAGTPLRPGQNIPTFLFALIDENLKGESPVEQHFGLYNPDRTPVYDISLTT